MSNIEIIGKEFEVFVCWEEVLGYLKDGWRVPKIEELIWMFENYEDFEKDMYFSSEKVSEYNDYLDDVEEFVEVLNMGDGVRSWVICSGVDSEEYYLRLVRDL